MKTDKTYEISAIWIEHWHVEAASQETVLICISPPTGQQLQDVEDGDIHRVPRVQQGDGLVDDHFGIETSTTQLPIFQWWESSLGKSASKKLRKASAPVVTVSVEVAAAWGAPDPVGSDAS